MQHLPSTMNRLKINNPELGRTPTHTPGTRPWPLTAHTKQVLLILEVMRESVKIARVWLKVMAVCSSKGVGKSNRTAVDKVAVVEIFQHGGRRKIKCVQRGKDNGRRTKYREESTHVDIRERRVVAPAMSLRML